MFMTPQALNRFSTSKGVCRLPTRRCSDYERRRAEIDTKTSSEPVLGSCLARKA